MREKIKKKHNSYWIWDYGAVVPFQYETHDEDGELLAIRKQINKSHIGREELEECIEVLQYALEKRKAWEKLNTAKDNKVQ